MSEIRCGSNKGAAVNSQGRQPRFFSPEGAAVNSPGRQPRDRVTWTHGGALKGRQKPDVITLTAAPLGLLPEVPLSDPGRKPRAIDGRPFGAEDPGY